MSVPVARQPSKNSAGSAEVCFGVRSPSFINVPSPPQKDSSPAWRNLLEQVCLDSRFECASALLVVSYSSALYLELYCNISEPWIDVICCAYVPLLVVDLLFRIAGCRRPRWWEDHCLVIDATALAFAVVSGILALDLSQSEMYARGFELIKGFQFVRLVRPCSILCGKHRTGRVAFRAFGWTLENILAVLALLGTFWLPLVLITTGLMKDVASSDSHEAGDIAATYFYSMPVCALTLLKACTGSVDMNEVLLRPMFMAGNWQLQLLGAWLLGIVYFTSVCVWNLILAMCAQQVISIADDVDNETEEQQSIEGEQRVRKLRSMLQTADADGDGFISSDELRRDVVGKAEVLQLVGLTANEVEVLHASLASAHGDQVSISDMLFGMLKLAGYSQGVDVLSIGYRQEVFRRDVEALEAVSFDEFEKVNAMFGHVLESMLILRGDIASLSGGLKCCREELEAELCEESEKLQITERVAAEEAALEEAKRYKEECDSRRTVETYVDYLREEVEHLAHARVLDSLCFGSESDHLALRRAVRKRLEMRLSPWMDAELRGSGLSLKRPVEEVLDVAE